MNCRCIEILFIMLLDAKAKQSFGNGSISWIDNYVDFKSLEDNQKANFFQSTSKDLIGINILKTKMYRGIFMI